MLTPAKREQLRMMFGGKCAYCGCEFTGKWHADHVMKQCAVMRMGGRCVSPKITGMGISTHPAPPATFSKRQDRPKTFACH